MLSLARRIWPSLCSERAERVTMTRPNKEVQGTKETHPGMRAREGGPIGTSVDIVTKKKKKKTAGLQAKSVIHG